MSSKMVLLKVTFFLAWALSMPKVVESQNWKDLLERIEQLERDVRRLKDAQICNPTVIIDDVLNTTTNETIDQIVTCRYRDDVVDHVEFGQTNVVFNGTTKFNETVQFDDDVRFNRPVKFGSNVEINLDRSSETFNVNGRGQMTVSTSQPLDVKTQARFQSINGVEVDYDLTVTQGYVVLW